MRGCRISDATVANPRQELLTHVVAQIPTKSCVAQIMGGLQRHTAS